MVLAVVRAYDDHSQTGIVPPINDVEAVRHEDQVRIASFRPLRRYLDDLAVGD